MKIRTLLSTVLPAFLRPSIPEVIPAGQQTFSVLRGLASELPGVGAKDFTLSEILPAAETRERVRFAQHLNASGEIQFADAKGRPFTARYVRTSAGGKIRIAPVSAAVA
jgi:hypothetical protein